MWMVQVFFELLWSTASWIHKSHVLLYPKINQNHWQFIRFSLLYFSLNLSLAQSFLDKSCERWLHWGSLREPVHQCQHVTSTAEMLKYPVTYSNYYHLHVFIEHFLLLLQRSAKLVVPFPAVRSAPCWQFNKLLKWVHARFDHDLHMTFPLLPLFIY